MQVSASTNIAPISSAARPISISRPKAARRTPLHDMPISAASAAWWLTRSFSRCSGQRSDVFFKQRPCLVARFLLHLAIKPGLFQHVLKRLGVWRVEGHALAGQVLRLIRGHLLPVLALGERGGVEVL